MEEQKCKKRSILLTSEELCDVLIILKRDIDNRKKTLQRWKGNEDLSIFIDESDKMAYVSKMADLAKKLEDDINFTEQIIENIESSI